MVAHFQHHPSRLAGLVRRLQAVGMRGSGPLAGRADLPPPARVDRDEVAVAADRRDLKPSVRGACAPWPAAGSRDVGVQHHAVQAVQAFAVVDAAIGINGQGSAQPTAQALQLLQSCLRLRPNQRKVLGMASAAPSGQMYLQ